MAVCVKEADGSWTHVPIALFFRTGYESRRQRPAYYHALHGGLDMKIEGPLVGVSDHTGLSNKCDIQFYMVSLFGVWTSYTNILKMLIVLFTVILTFYETKAIEGMCGWHSNHQIEVPWIEAVSTTRLYSQEEALTAVRMSGILACAFNQIGTEMDLPFGGYGVLGVCNDTAAIVDFAVRGETNMYPLLSTGRFLMHTAKFLVGFHDDLVRSSNAATKRIRTAAAETLRLASAACNMQSDIHCSPKQMIDAARRYASNYPTAYFQITTDSKEVMAEITEQYLDLESKISKIH